MDIDQIFIKKILWEKTIGHNKKKIIVLKHFKSHFYHFNSIIQMWNKILSVNSLMGWFTENFSFGYVIYRESLNTITECAIFLC